MLTFNLLPPEQKAELRFYRTSTTIANRTILLAGLATVFALLIGFTLVSLRAKKTALEVAKEAKVGDAAISSAQKAQQEIDAFNKELRVMTSAFTDRSWSRLLEDIGKLASPTIRLTDVRHEVAQGKETMVLVGHAEKREDLVLFEEGLKKSPLFTSITSPLANFRKPDDVDFTVSAELAPAHDDAFRK